MSHIYIYSPSSAQRDKPALRRGVARLEALGHEVELDRDVYATHMRFAGDDATRLAAIHRAAASGADVAMISRGGYGLTRILDRIRYAAVARAVAHGTRFVGYSDLTAFQAALYAKTQAMSWMGPAVGEDVGAESGPDPIMLDCLEDLLAGRGEGTGWRLPAVRAAKAAVVPERQRARVVRNATLWGGNLSVLTALMGTPYFPQIKGGILCLEDVAEHPYRVERMLSQLLHGGVLAGQKAIVLGQFTNYKLAPNDKGFNLATVVQWLREALPKVQVLTNLPIGHVPTKVLLPFGVPTQLVVEGRDALLYWGHLHAGHEDHEGHAH